MQLGQLRPHTPFQAFRFFRFILKHFLFLMPVALGYAPTAKDALRADCVCCGATRFVRGWGGDRGDTDDGAADCSI